MAHIKKTFYADQGNSAVLKEIVYQASLDDIDSAFTLGLYKRPAADRKKVRVAITVEAEKKASNKVSVDSTLLEQLKADSARHKELLPRFCDGERIITWLDDQDRKQANTAFTDSFERQIGYRFERLQSLEKTARMYEYLRKLNPRQFAELHQRNIAGEGAFDDLVMEAMKHETDSGN